MIKLRDCDTPVFCGDGMPLCDREFLSTDGKLLNLCYPSALNVEELQSYIEEIARSHPIYETVDTLLLQTDFVNSMPDNVRKFKNLTKLIVTGSRFWSLDMQYVPLTVKSIDLREHTNLQPTCVNGMERLAELESVMFSDAFLIGDFLFEEFDKEYLKQVIPIPVLPKLARITVDVGHGAYELCLEEYNPGWKDQLIGHPLLEKVKHLVTDISLRKDERGAYHVIVELAVKNSS